MIRIWFYKILLGPLLLVQGRRVRRTALRLPEALGDRQGVVGGPNLSAPVRLLFLGDSTMAGVGVEHQSAGLARQVSALVGAKLGRLVHWQLVARTGLNTREMIAFAMKHELLSADVLVTSLGTNDVTSQQAPSRFIGSYEALVDAVSQRVHARHAVISGLPPLHLTPVMPQPLRWYMGAYARLLDGHLQRWIRSRAGLSYVSLQWADPTGMAADRYHPGEGQYRLWAQLLAEVIVQQPCVRLEAPPHLEANAHG